MNPTNPTDVQMGASLDQGIAMADAVDEVAAKAKVQEEAFVKAWLKRYARSRKHDLKARRQYARDRMFARGDSSREVASNLCGTYIDIQEAFLYARNPDFDIRPGPTVRPPGNEAMQDAIEQQMREAPDPAIGQQVAIAQAGAAANGADPQQVGEHVQNVLVAQAIQQQMEEMRKSYARRQREVRSYAETCEIVGTKAWEDAALKRRGRKWVREALTVGLGVMKFSWQERTAPSAETSKAINDLQENIEQARALQIEINDETGSDKKDALVAELAQQMDTLKSKDEVVIARQMVVDVVKAEDIQIPEGFDWEDYLDVPWMAQRIPMTVADARGKFQLTDEDVRQCRKFSPREPVMLVEVTPQMDGELDDTSVDYMESDSSASEDDFQSTSGSMSTKGGGKFVIALEIWDRMAGKVYTTILGLKKWVKDPFAPCYTKRFFPYFTLCMTVVSGQRHPQSNIARSYKIFNEINRLNSNLAEHRRRALPGILFNGSAMDPEQVKKIMAGGIQEWINVTLTDASVPIGSAIMAKPYAPIDPSLYNTRDLVDQLERIWGIQEALSGGIQVDKTATEAGIQQSGFQARTTSRRDDVDMSLSEAAGFTVELLRCYMEHDDVVAVAGPDAFWPPYEGPSDTMAMLTVDIAAGSTGKPDTQAERSSMAAVMPVLQQGIIQIGQLRQSSPADIADGLETLLQMFIDATGKRVDIDQLVPQATAAPPPAPGVPGQPQPGQPGQPGQPNPPGQPGSDPSAPIAPFQPNAPAPTSVMGEMPLPNLAGANIPASTDPLAR